ncbi:MAG: hypothetical protein EOM91_15430 [Sphingobacteriia bacterium]|nr:hypothetical protein [Sphingobacteriia bacterium]NCC40337.1 hypothetical protein [Gammaproteobacteria bacterium]
MAQTTPIDPTGPAVALLALALLSGAASAPAGASGMAWDACRDQTIAALEAAGRRDHGDVSAYTGASGAGALIAIIERCGYRPERLSRDDCDLLYEQVYLSCRLDGFEGMSIAATSWVLIYDPKGPLVRRLKQSCAQTANLDRASFGLQVCLETH